MCGLNVLLEMEITLMEIVILMLDCENVLLVAEFYLGNIFVRSKSFQHQSKS